MAEPKVAPLDLTLILTVLNEAASMPSFLESVRSQTRVPREIVVVDGGSTDSTVERVKEWDPPEGCVVHVHVEPGAGISQGRNVAIAAASAERVLVTDAGTQLATDWVEAMWDAFQANPDAAVISGWFQPAGSGTFERALAFTITPRLSEVDPARFLPSSRSLGLNRSAWESVGGYPEWLDYCEDLVFDLALKESGFKFAFAPAAMVSWSGRPTLKAFAKQYYRYARGDGKAGLWPRRHLIRYASYAVGVIGLAIAPRQPLAIGLLGAGALAYMQKFFRRVIQRRAQYGRSWPLAVALVPIIVVSGDIAKMVGYPRGLRWRKLNPPSGRP